MNKVIMEKQPQGTLGTFAGVFTPSILTILGIILFLRLGFVVGSAGLGPTLLILCLANGISILTSVSLAAIATNLKVKGGGDYYLISRTLGIEFGGAIGIVLFLAQCFGEVLAYLIPLQVKAAPQIIAAVAVSFLFIFAWLGTDWATRFQYVVMSIIVVAIASFIIGGLLKWDSALLSQNWAPSGFNINFWGLFAIFFPAVTGFTQGVSMSGDLKNPGKSLPTGTSGSYRIYPGRQHVRRFEKSRKKSSYGHVCSRGPVHRGLPFVCRTIFSHASG
jgi:amino acid transporter